ncbi:ribonuclease H-like domain-containing protein [Tanacetum coccineum]|uniref:Ribonuclease H-like domain-containing protein n=1 Tax=Tanacetum coccineum TaxID=301880 RepID=A0ABQ5GYT0_9ASTR
MRGRDESVSSLNRGMYLEALHFLRDHNEEIRAVTLENAPKNCILTSPKIQKDIVECFAKEIVNNICLEIGDDVFSLLVDESSDVVKKEQMAVVLRYVDKFGLLKERFLGIIHVKNTSSSTLKAGIDSLFNEHKLSMQQDKVTMEQAIRVLVVMAVAKNHKSVRDFFDVLSTVMNVSDQTILEAVSLVKGTKRALQEYRETGFPSLLKNVASFCGKHDIEMVNMAEFYSRGRRDKITNQHHFEVDIFNTIMDMQIQEFGDRFSEGSTDLLDCMVALSPHDSFSEFSISKLVKLSEMYPRDFTYKERLSLPMELGVYYQIVRNDDDFANLDSIARLAQKMVDKKKHTSHPLVYRLLKLALVLPVATATVERCFSKMKLIKTNLRNRMGDEYFSGALTYAIEKEELVNVKNEGLVLLGEKGKLLLSPQQVVIRDTKDITRTKSPNTMVDQVQEIDYPQRALQNKGIVDSGCSRHMTGNKAYLAEYQDFNGGPVAFGGKLQHFNLFSVSQMCDKKNKVLFTDTECLVLSPEFKLPDENQVLLRIPRQNNMYSFNLEKHCPSGRSENQANKHAGLKEANHSVGTEDNIDAGNSEIEAESAQDYFVLPIWSSYTLTVKSSKAKNVGEEPNKNPDLKTDEKPVDKEDQLIKLTKLSTTSPYGGLSFTDTDQDDSKIPALEDMYDHPTNGIFTNASYDDEGRTLQFKIQENLGFLVDLPLWEEGKLEQNGFTEIRRMNEMDVKVPSVCKIDWRMSWYATLSTFLLKSGYRRGTIDKTLFIKKDKNDIMLVKVYVDDIIFGSTKRSWCDEFEALMKSRFQMSSMGVDKILKKFDFASVKTASTPIETHKPLVKDEEASEVSVLVLGAYTEYKLRADGSPVSDPTLYRSLAGALQYLIFTRPDLSYAVQQVCLYMHDHREPHLAALKRILRYVRDTSDYRLQLYSSSTSSLVTYSDADWAGCPTARRSTSVPRGGANAVVETSWLHNILRELHSPLHSATIVYCDNVSAMYLSSNLVQHQRTKHIEIDIRFVRDRVYTTGQVRVLHVSSRYQYADIFTKGLPTALFYEFRTSLSIFVLPLQLREAITEIRASASEVYHGDAICQEKSKFLLTEMGLPNGLLPLEDIEECGYVEKTGFVWLKQKKEKKHKFEKIDKLTSYATEVTAFIEKFKIKKLTGVKTKEMLMWITLSEISVDNPNTGKITFKATSGLFRTFPVSAFQVEDVKKDVTKSVDDVAKDTKVVEETKKDVGVEVAKDTQAKVDVAKDTPLVKEV